MILHLFESNHNYIILICDEKKNNFLIFYSSKNKKRVNSFWNYKKNIFVILKIDFGVWKIFIQNFVWRRKCVLLHFHLHLSRIKGWLALTCVWDHYPGIFDDSFVWLTIEGILNWDARIDCISTLKETLLQEV